MNDLLLALPATLSDALRKIEESGQGIVFLQRNEILVGSISDGDVRRHILDGIPITNSAESFMNVSVTTLPLGSTPIEIHKAFSRGISHIPIVDAFGRVIEIITPFKNSTIP